MHRKGNYWHFYNSIGYDNVNRVRMSFSSQHLKIRMKFFYKDTTLYIHVLNYTNIYLYIYIYIVKVKVKVTDIH